MKTTITKFSVALIGLFLLAGTTFTANAQALGDKFKVGKLYYLITNLSPAEVAVAPQNTSSWNVADKPTGAVVIPAKVSNAGKTYTVSAIRYGAFYGCADITSVVIPESVTEIGASAFNNCKGLTTVNLPKNLVKIYDRAFLHTNITTFDIPATLTYLGGRAFDFTPWYNNQPDGLFYINTILYQYKGTMPANTGIVVKPGTTMISSDVLTGGHSNLTSISFPTSLETIGWRAFSSCVNLTKISIPPGVKSIEGLAFDGCTGVTSIESQIVDPTGVISSFAAISQNCFRNIPVSAVLYVPKGSKSVYASMQPWSQFTNIVEKDMTEKYPLYVAGTQVTSANAANITGAGITGKVSYNATTKTLTLNGAAITTAGEGIKNEIDGLTINLTGNINTITSTAKAGIYSKKNCIITGSSSNEFRVVASLMQFGIYVEKSSMTITGGCKVDASGEWGIIGDVSRTSMLTINGSQ